MRLKNFCIPIQWGYPLYVMRAWENFFKDEFDSLADFLLPTDDLSPRHPGTEASYWQELKVQIEPDGRIIGAPNRSRIRIELTKADILLHKFDMYRLRKEMCDSFGLMPQTGEIDQWERTVPWGFWEAEKGAKFPVTLFQGWSGRQFRDRLMEAALNREAAGEIILTANRYEWREDVPDIARKHKLLLVPLDEIIQMEDGKLLPTQEWNEYLTAFCKMVEMDLPSKYRKKAQGYVFARRDDEWFLQYGETTSKLELDLLGAPFIQYLLKYPDQRIHVRELWGELMGTGRRRKKIESDFAETLSGLFEGDAMVDREAEENYRNRLLELSQKRIKAEGENKTYELDQINTEFEMIKSTLDSARGFGGRTVKIGNETQKLADRVRQIINRALKSIRKNNPNMAQYLKNSIERGVHFKYNSSSEVSWKFE
ncbi:MAG: hypothetical protein FWD31_04415 [Planctomycetaceae bacterium]|nr:hypothetical protein [Planctomycetaceae bacterium]